MCFFSVFNISHLSIALSLQLWLEVDYLSLSREEDNRRKGNSQKMEENSREMDGLLKVADIIHAVRRKVVVGLRKPHVLKVESKIAAVEQKIAAVEEQIAAVERGLR